MDKQSLGYYNLLNKKVILTEDNWRKIKMHKENIRILYGTTNPAKLKSMKQNLSDFAIEVIGLKDLNLRFEAVDESGNIPLENARLKALAYHKVAKMPVFSCDSGLYIECLEAERQPGVHVRRVNGKELNDEEMIAYYAGLAEEFGGVVKAKYKNAIVLVVDENHIYEYDGEEISSKYFYISSKAHSKRNLGFPLDSISIEIESHKYFMDMNYEEGSSDDFEVDKGYKNFFRNIGYK